MTEQGYEYGRGAEMRVLRAHLGIDIKNMQDMAALLGVALSTYQRWENGRDRIPTGIWPRVERLYEMFDEAVDQLLQSIPEGTEPVNVRVWRGKRDENTEWPQAFPGVWLRVVGEAARAQPRIRPRYPDDDE
ncbi:MULTISPECIES: helix-turn-helix domain-containing protein [Nocardia]|uniref:helix-turn-helix domain-containing protein n=1 Tax=Nocardia TaxID=1817 RepID=UPI002456CC1E|nr:MULTISPECIES: helix-turn-helix transcriptional regulator [Nocardia]